MNFPDNLKYTKDHEWVLVDGDVATIGVTDFAQSELGDIVFVDISSQGDTLAAHEVFGTVEAVKTVSDLYMPVSGEVIEVNANMDASPESVNSDPYGRVIFRTHSIKAREEILGPLFFRNSTNEIFNDS